MSAGGRLALQSSAVSDSVSVTEGILSALTSSFSDMISLSDGSTATLSGSTLTAGISVTGSSGASLSSCSLSDIITISGSSAGLPLSAAGAGTSIAMSNVAFPDTQFADVTQTYTVGLDGHSLLEASPGAVDAFCFANYHTLDEPWRSVTADNPGPQHHDNDQRGQDSYIPHPMGQGWYRFVGAGGDALPLSNPGSCEPSDACTHRCGTDHPGWLNGVDLSACLQCAAGEAVWQCCTGSAYSDVQSFLKAGGLPGPTPVRSSYPEPGQGVTSRLVCFGNGATEGGGCPGTIVSVLNCGSFLLWELGNTPNAYQGYCTTDSGFSTKIAQARMCRHFGWEDTGGDLRV